MQAERPGRSSFLERLIFRWSVLSEPRVLLESYLACSLLPFLFSILPSWIVVSGGPVHRDGVVDYSRGLEAILFAPIAETVFIFAPILELCRYFKLRPLWVVLGFALFFELLHTQRAFSVTSCYTHDGLHDLGVHGHAGNLFYTPCFSRS